MFFIFNILKIFTAFQFIWTNTIIEIPLNDNIENYINLPSAEIYNNNQKIETDIYYIKGVNHTFISVLNSRHVKKYYIYYEAYAPAYQISSTMQIVFDVVDNIPPNLVIKDYLESPLNEKILEIKDYIQYDDNYYNQEDLKVIIDTKRVNTKIVGTYDVYVSVTDKSNNTTTKIIKYSIFDHIKPTIEIIKEPKITVNESINLKNFFNFKDNYDQNLTVWYDNTKIDFSKLGEYPLNIYVKDSSGNLNSLSTTIKVIDDKPPELLIQSNIPPLNYNESIDSDFFRKYVLLAKDNYDDINIDNVIIMHDIQINHLGKYNILYYLKDSSGNITEKKVTIEVKDLEAPKVEIKKELVSKVFSDAPYIYDYFIFTDNYTELNRLTIKITEKINTKITGEYPITLEIADENKNTFKAVFKFSVIDDSKPIIEQTKDIILNVYETKKYIDFFTIIDNYDKELLISFDENLIDYKKTGNYTLKVTATDSSQNQTVLETTVYILDLEPPEIILKNDKITYFIGDKIPDLKTYIDNVYDNYDDITVDKIKIIDDINFEKVGLYEIKYQIHDYSGNLGEKSLYLYVDIKEEIEFNITDFIINLGEIISFSQYIDYKDETLMIYHNQEIVNNNIPGIYFVTYYVTNQRGVTKVYNQKIEVIDDNIKLNDYIVPILILAGTVISIILITKKRMFF